MYYMFERVECPASATHLKERAQNNMGGLRLKHDFKKVSGLRKLVNLLIQEAQSATAKKINRDKAVENALYPLTSDKVKIGALKRFAKGDTLQNKQYSALFAVIGGMIKDDSVPIVWRADLPCDPQKNFYSLKPADDQKSDIPADQETPVTVDDDPDWLKQAILANANSPSMAVK